MHEPDLSAYHERIRRRGVNAPVYWTVRAVIQPLLLLYFRVRRHGREHVPEGGVILASNHRSFLDPWIVGVCVGRPVYFFAKRELFHNRLQGWFLNALGAFPVRRGESDEEALATSRAILERGDALVIFPEGTRIRRGGLGHPRRGVGRVVLETGAPVVPIALIGTERARRRRFFILPVGIRVRCGRPLTYPRVDSPSPRLAREVTERIWPCVQLQWEWLGGLAPLRRAAVVGAGSMGLALAALLERAGLEVQLVSRTTPIDAAELDLVVLAVPSRDLHAAVEGLRGGLPAGCGIAVATKGLVAPHGQTPAAHAAACLRPRAVAAMGGPAHARETLTSGAAVVVASPDPDFARQLGDVLSQSGLEVEATDDLIGCELASCAKNAASLAAAAAAERAGANAAGAAAGRVFSEVHRLAERRGARSETFAGLAGAGDLVSTVLAPGSRNRRAGELLGKGMSPEAVAAAIGETAEALDMVPLLSQAARHAGVEAPAVDGLDSLLQGRIEAEEWVAGLAGSSRLAA